MNEANPQPPLMAFELDFLEMRTVTFAESPAQARWFGVKSAREAGYLNRRQWPSISVRRRASLDKFPHHYYPRGRCFTPSFVETYP